MIALFESINHPLVNIPNYGTAPTGAFVLGTRNDHGHFTVFVYLHQAETRALVVYVSDPRALAPDQYRVEEADAVRFVESLGFLVDNLQFTTRSPREQDAIMARVPIFRPPMGTVDLYDVADESAPVSAFSTGALPEALFGGLSADDQTVFRQAGLDPARSRSERDEAERRRFDPPVPPTNTAGLGSVAEIPPGFVAAAPPSPSSAPLGVERLSSVHSSSDARPSSPPSRSAGMPAPAAFENTASLAGAAASVTGGLAPAPLSASLASLAEPAESSSPPRTGVERLGRLLGTFAVLLALSAPAGCTSNTPTFEERRALDSYIDLAHQQLAQGMWPDAIKTFRSVLEQDDEHRDALRGMGLAYLNLGRSADAEKHLRAAVQADPDWSVPKNELAVVLIEQGRCAEAEEVLGEVLKDIFYQTPQFAEHNLARAHACQGRIDQAIKLLENVVLKRPLFCLGYLTLAEFSSTARRHEVTIRACDDFVHHCEQNEKIRAQIASEQSALCYLKKGLAYAELGDVESARASFSRCPPGGPHGRECQRSLAMLPR